MATRKKAKAVKPVEQPKAEEKKPIVYDPAFEELFYEEWENAFQTEEYAQLFNATERNKIREAIKETCSKHYEVNEGNVYRSAYGSIDWPRVQAALSIKDTRIASINGEDLSVYIGHDTLGIPIFYSDLFTCARDNPHGLDIIGFGYFRCDKDTQSDTETFAEMVKEIRRYR